MKGVIGNSHPGWTMRSAIASVAVVLAVLGISLSNEYQEATEHAQKEMDSLSRVLEEHALATAQKADLVVRGAQAQVRPGDLQTLREENAPRARELNALLKSAVEQVPDINILVVSNADGERIYSSNHPAAPVNIADRPYFQRHKNDPASGLVFSNPIVSRNTGKWSITLSRRLNFEDGSFAGTVHAALNLEYFQQFYRTLDQGAQGLVALYDKELHLAARYPPSEKDMGNVANLPFVRMEVEKGTRHATFRVKSTLDSVRRLFSVRQVGGLPLLVVAGIAEDDYLAGWHRHIWLYGIGALLFSLVTLGLGLRQQRVEDALKQSEARFRKLTEMSSDFYWESDSEHRLTVRTESKREAAEEVFRKASLTGRRRWEIPYLFPDEAGWQAYRTTLEAHLPFRDFEIARRRDNGAVHHVSISGDPVFDAAGTFKGYRGMGTDITERKQAEAALRASEEKFAIAFRASPMLISISSAGEGRFIEVNEGFLRAMNRTREEVIGHTSHEIGLWKNHGDRQRAIDILLKDGRIAGFEADLCSKSGEPMPFAIWGETIEIGGLQCVIWVTMDIADRKRADALLRARLRLSELAKTGTLDDLLQCGLDAAEAVTGSQIGFLHLVDPDQENLTLQAWSTNTVKRMCTAEGKGQHYPISEAGVWADAFHARSPVIHNDYASLESRKGLPEGHAAVTRELVVPIIRNGKVTEILGVGNKAGDYNQADVDALLVIAGSLQDLLQRISAEKELRESESRLSAIFHASPIGISISRRSDGRLLEVNDAALRMYGYRRDEVMGQSAIGLGVYVEPEQHTELLRQLKEYGKVDRMLIDIRKGSGELGQAEVSCRIVTFEGEQRLLSMMEDVTSRKRMEKMNLQAQKMEALGTLAGGVAHDFNNIIASIMGNAELARQDVGPVHDALESLEEIRKAGRRAKDLVQQILAFGRKQALERRVISLAPAVEEAGQLLRSTLPAGVSLKVRCDPDVPTVLADKTQIEQILLNLCSNAWQAMENGKPEPLIEVRLQSHEQPAGGATDARFETASGALQPGRYACLMVRDNGSGMDAQTLARMFEPFYTTKPVGKGTGLGLSVVHSIAQDHGASIRVRSIPGEGSTFRIYFPQAQTSAQHSPAAAVRHAPAHGHGKHILYIDDDEAIVFLMTRLLERQGYRVSGYTEAQAALSAVRTDPGQFDLAVTDYNMPGMSGLDVARALKEIRADLPVALASGYITDELRQEAPAAGVSELIYKPNTAEDLCEAVARLAGVPDGNGRTS